MKLEELYESHFVGPGAQIKNATSFELLEMFEEAAKDSSDVSFVLKSLKSKNLMINESVLVDSKLSEDSKIFLEASQRLLQYYYGGNDKHFNSRLDCILEKYKSPAAASRGAVPPVISAAPAAPAAPAGSGKENWFTRAAKGLASWLGKIGGAFLKGFKGSEGKDAQGKAKPGWKDISVDTDLSKIPEGGATFTPKQLVDLKVDSATLQKLQDGAIAGINLTDGNNNLVQIKFAKGQYLGNSVPTFKAAADAGAATKAATAAPAAASTKPAAAPAAKPAAPAAKPVAPAAPAAAAPAAPAPAAAAPRIKNSGKKPDKPTVKESTFDDIFRETIHNFYKN